MVLTRDAVYEVQMLRVGSLLTALLASTADSVELFRKVQGAFGEVV